MISRRAVYQALLKAPFQLVGVLSGLIGIGGSLWPDKMKSIVGGTSFTVQTGSVVFSRCFAFAPQSLSCARRVLAVRQPPFCASSLEMTFRSHVEEPPQPLAPGLSRLPQRAEGDEVEEVEDPPFSFNEGVTPVGEGRTFRPGLSAKTARHSQFGQPSLGRSPISPRRYRSLVRST